MAKFEFDLIVVGGGSGGVRAARRAAALGRRVLLVEAAALGGTCVNVGCVPKKLLYYAAGMRGLARLGPAFGFAAAEAGPFAWARLLANKDAEIARLNAVYEKLLSSAGVTVVRGMGRLEDGHAVRVGKAVFRGECVLLAVGGAPARPALSGGEMAEVSDDLFFLPDLPRRVAIVGGGYIALEFAGIFNGLGAETTLCFRADLPMRGLDDDVRRRLADGVAASGVRVLAEAVPERIARGEGGEKVLHLQGGETVVADVVALATGRRPRVAGLGLEAVGVAADGPGGTIAVDADFRTYCRSVCALGDLIATPALTPVATAEAEVFVRRVFGGDGAAAVDYAAVPTAVFSRPGYAGTGVSEAAAARCGMAVTAHGAAFRSMRSAFAGGDGESFVKLVCAEERVVGAQMVGEDAAEIMQGMAVAIRAGATRDDFLQTVGIHPSSAEEFVTLDLRRR